MSRFLSVCYEPKLFSLEVCEQRHCVGLEKIVSFWILVPFCTTFRHLFKSQNKMSLIYLNVISVLF